MNTSRQRNTSSGAIECPWHANLNWPKTSPAITLTSFKDEHNHELNPLIEIMAPMFCKFTSEMHDDVKFYINNGSLNVKQEN